MYRKSRRFLVKIVLSAIFLTQFTTSSLADIPKIPPVPKTQYSTKQNINDTTRLKLILQTNISNNLSEPSELKEAGNFAESKKLNSFYAHLLYQMAQEKRIKEEYQTAKILDFEGLTLARGLNDSRLATDIYIDLSIIFRKSREEIKAIEYSKKALAYARKNHDSTNMSIALNNMGNSYLQLKKNTTALDFFKRSLRLEQSRKNMTGVAINLNNVGKVYLAQKEYSRAINYFNLSLEINKQINSQKGIAICYSDLSDAYEGIEDFAKAQESATQSLKLYLKGESRKDKALAFIKLGVLNSKNGLYQRAIINLEQGIKLSQQTNNSQNLLIAYLTLYEIYKSRQDFQKALHYNSIANLYQDSLSNLAISNQTISNKLLSGSKQREEQISLLSQQNQNVKLSLEEKQYWINVLMFIIILLIGILIFLTWLTWIIRKKNEQLIQKNLEIERVKTELERKSDELLEANRNAEKNALTKNRFLAHISHEIRTPLNSVLGFAELLKQSQIDPAQQHYLKAINTAGKSLLSLLNNILDFAKYDNDDLNFKLEEISLDEVLTEVSNIFSLKASEKNLQLVIDFQTSLTDIILFNQMVLQQILLNLVGNAIKYTYEGAVKVILTETKSGTNQINLNIEVSDTGSGISKKDLEYIFEPFYQGNTLSKSEGAGLGLSITKTLVKKMGGEISVKSNLNSGTTFLITFNNIQVPSNEIKKSTYKNSPTRFNNYQLLFISTKNKISDSIKTQFSSENFNIIDVGLRLAEAKKHMESIPLIVLCCLNYEETNNTLNIIENFISEKNQQILILQNHDKSFENHLPKTQTIKLQSEDYRERIAKFIDDLKQDNRNFDLFESQSTIDDEELSNTLFHLYKNSFEQAYSSRMLDKIEEMRKQLQAIAKNKEMPHLHIFVDEMKYNIKEFDISALDKQLDLLKKQILSVINTQ